MRKQLIPLALIFSLEALLLSAATAQIGIPWPGPGGTAGAADAWVLKASVKSCPSPTAAIDTTGANLLIAGYNCFGASCVSGSTVSDSKGNAWTFIGVGAASADTGTLLWYSVPTSVGSGHTFSTNAAAPAFFVEAWSGSIGASPLRTSNQTDSSQTAGSITPTAGDLVVALHGPQDTDSVSSVNSGFTIDQNQAYSFGNCVAGAIASQHPATGSAVNPAWTDTAGTGSSYIAAFKAP